MDLGQGCGLHGVRVRLERRGAGRVPAEPRRPDRAEGPEQPASHRICGADVVGVRVSGFLEAGGVPPVLRVSAFCDYAEASVERRIAVSGFLHSRAARHPAHHVQDGLLPLKQTVRHLLEPRTTFLVRRFTARVGDGLSARSFVTGPDTGLTDGNAAPTMDAVGRQSHDELAWTDRIPSPGGWTPPSGVKPGWAWLPPSGASPAWRRCRCG